MLLCLSSSHRNAGSDLLERLSIGAPSAPRTLVDTKEFVTGAVVLATCNRFEAYLDIDETRTGPARLTFESVISAMAEASGVTTQELRESTAVHRGAAVAAHLFAVSSGLESVVVGEDEIAGQVSRALADARTQGTTSPDLERLFQRASRTSRGVKNTTALGGLGRSMAGLALELASSRITEWAETSVLVVGTGRHAATTVAALRALGARDIRVYSPSGRAAAFAARHGLTAETDLARAVADADVIVACTTRYVLRADAFVPGRRLIVIDLGLPRSVDPAVGTVAGVEFLDLETIKLHAPLETMNAHDDARALIKDAAAGFIADSAAGPAIAALRRQVFETLDAEIVRARSRGAGDETEAALRHFAGVLLHGPSVRIRDLAGEGRIDELSAALHLVHGIQVTSPSEPAGRAETG